MAVNINLLPTELKVSTGLSRGLGIIRMLGVISLAAFLIFGFGLGAFFLISNSELNNLKTANDGLKTRVTALSTTESQFFILKDRISKIKIALAMPSATKNLMDFEPSISIFQNSDVQELNVSPSKISTTIDFRNAGDLKNFLSFMSGSTTYSSVIVDSFGYSQSGDYQVNMNLVAK